MSFEDDVVVIGIEADCWIRIFCDEAELDPTPPVMVAMEDEDDEGS